MLCVQASSCSCSCLVEVPEVFWWEFVAVLGRFG